MRLPWEGRLPLCLGLPVTQADAGSSAHLAFRVSLPS